MLRRDSSQYTASAFPSPMAGASLGQRLGIWLLAVAFPSSLTSEIDECLFSFLTSGSWQLDLFFLEEGRHAHSVVNDNTNKLMSLNRSSRMLYYFPLQGGNLLYWYKYLKYYRRPGQK